MSKRVHGFLEELGERLRAAREDAGLSVTQVAESAGVSRRHLTEAEAGRANPSVLVVARLALALRVPLVRLLDIHVQRSTERVALVGLRGAGKTTLGRRLARALEVPFVELDRRVEEAAGLSLAEIFDLEGPDAFHRYEAEALERVLAEGERLVIATSGSIVDHQESYRRLLATCRTVWLRASAQEHYRRVWEAGDKRPMAGRSRAKAELAGLLKERAESYSRCEIKLDTNGMEPEDLVVLALAALGMG